MLDVVDVRGVVPNPGIPVPGVGGIGDGGLEGGECLGEFDAGDRRNLSDVDRVRCYVESQGRNGCISVASGGSQSMPSNSSTPMTSVRAV